MTADRIPVDQFTWNRSSRSVKHTYRLLLEGKPDEGDEVWIPAFEIAGDEDGPNLLILAGIHGDEYEGIETILRLFSELLPEDIRGNLLMIPCANPYAYEGGTRLSPDDGVNLARVFPGQQSGTVTEKLAYELHHRMIAKADFLLDLHSGGTHYAVASLVGYYQEEGSAFSQRCREAAEAFGAKLMWAHDEISPGRSVSSAQALGIPWLYTEAYGGRRVRQEDARLFYGGTIRLINHLEMLVDPLKWPIDQQEMERKTIYSDGNFDHSATAEEDGFFIPAIPLESEVRQGDLIGTIYALDGSELQRVLAGSDGFLVMILGIPVIRKGDPVYLLASVTSS
ncbi:succinylglutamate desuccinylase/aspartoacylase family protein [Paenibacillus nasutitermitis]|uniref:succinylglutamate desuccinylase/aspartoacylase family protein n=1 Tax=Paenibacillus nasutitermitis TaxID=1652958 RepID=UPI00166673AE|nr:M14 family metallopeptidase [Paenibacillus nasutitermitis]